MERITIEERERMPDYRAVLRDDVFRGLTRERKELPPKYFYDAVGSELFERICLLPEYYQTRTERGILESIARDLFARHPFSTLVELGSGSSVKTRVLLSAMESAGILERYVPIDVSRELLLETAERLVAEYRALEVHAVIGDFTYGVPEPEGTKGRLIALLGGTIGNFDDEKAAGLLLTLRNCMSRDDLFLLGVDLVKEADLLNAAYNDTQGVTAEFNMNVLRVINRELGGEFDLDRFSHYAFYNPFDARIEMHLVSAADQNVTIERLGLEVDFYRGETIRTEISRKFTRDSLEALLAGAAMEVVEWHTDPDRRFALAVIRGRGD